MGNFTWKQRYFSIFRKFKYLSSNVLLIIFSIIQWFLPQKWSQIWHFFSDFWDSASLIDSLFRCRNPHSVPSTTTFIVCRSSRFSTALSANFYLFDLTWKFIFRSRMSICHFKSLALEGKRKNSFGIMWRFFGYA